MFRGGRESCCHAGVCWTSAQQPQLVVQQISAPPSTWGTYTHIPPLFSSTPGEETEKQPDPTLLPPYSACHARSDAARAHPWAFVTGSGVPWRQEEAVIGGNNTCACPFKNFATYEGTWGGQRHEGLVY